MLIHAIYQLEVLTKSVSVCVFLVGTVLFCQFRLISMYVPMLIHVFAFFPQCDRYYYYVILISWCEKRETTTHQCLRKYFGHFCWDILVDTSKISPLISLKSTFGKVFFLVLHFTFTSISISILNCVWFFVWTKQYYIFPNFLAFGLFR